MTDFLNALATALFTYGTHSVVACLVALVLGRVMRRPQDRDFVWKAALVLPVVTTATVIVSAQAGVARMRIDLAHMARLSGLMTLPGRRVLIHVTDNGSGPAVLREFADPVSSALSLAAIAVALACMTVAAFRYAHRRRLLARALAGRQDVERIADGRIGLSVAPELPSPVALRGMEICLPVSVMHEFPERHRDTLVAHEIAHIERRDPAWFTLVELVTVLSAFQPLVFVVAHAFRRDVELICDEAAVRRTNDRQGLIGALALLASPFDAQSSIRCSPTAYDGSPLLARATRIAMLAEPVPHTRRLALLAMAGLLAALAFLPVISSAPRLEDYPLQIPGLSQQSIERHVRMGAGGKENVLVVRSRVEISSGAVLR